MFGWLLEILISKAEKNLGSGVKRTPVGNSLLLWCGCVLSVVNLS
jgi:hypothetical protein